MTPFIFFWQLIQLMDPKASPAAMFDMMEFLLALRLKISNPEALVERVILRGGF